MQTKLAPKTFEQVRENRLAEVRRSLVTVVVVIFAAVVFYAVGIGAVLLWLLG